MGHKIVATNRVFAETRALIESHGVLVAPEGDEPLDRQALIAHARDADAIMAFMTDHIDADLIASSPRLKVIGAALKGYDNIDVEAASRAGLWVTIVPDLLTVPTAELAIALMLALGRHLAEADAAVRANGFAGWRPCFYGTGLAGGTVGLIGFGAVGRAIARRLAGFDCTVTVADPGEPPLPDGVHARSLPALLGESDWVVLAAPLTDATLGLIGRHELGLMKQGARLVNPARGSLVDEAAVADALDSGALAGYAADVFECEDWARSDRPSCIEPRLVAPGAPTVLSPHIGSAVIEARRAIERSAAESILAALRGGRPAGAVAEPRGVGTC
jgi:phosphonate dehydrogenase